jgi:MFS family permease
MRLGDSARAFSATARNPSLRHAQLAFGASWTAEWAFMVAIGVVAFRAGGAGAVGLVAFVRMAPSAVLAPLGTSLADRFPRDRVLVWSGLIRAAATALAALVLATGGPEVAVYALAVIATGAFTVFRPAHSALLPGLCRTPLELTSANVVRGFLDSLSTLVGPLAAALLLTLRAPPPCSRPQRGCRSCPACCSWGCRTRRPRVAHPSRCGGSCTRRSMAFALSAAIATPVS